MPAISAKRTTTPAVTAANELTKVTTEFRKRIEANILHKLNDPAHAWPTGQIPIAVKSEAEQRSLLDAIKRMAPALAKRGVTIKPEAFVQPMNGGSPFQRISYSLDVNKVAKSTQALLKAGVQREVKFLTDELKGKFGANGNLLRAVWSDRDLGDYSKFIKEQVAPLMAKKGYAVKVQSVIQSGAETVAKLWWSKN